MQKAYYLAIMVLTIASCSGIPKEKEVTVSNVSISGTLRDFVKVVDGTYTLSNNGEDAFATIEFELINEPYGEVAPILSKTNSSQVILQIIDSKGNYIELGLWGFSADYRELEKLDDLIYKSKIGDKRRISFTMHYFNSNENSELVFTNATNFEVIDRAFSYSSDEDVVSIKTSDSKSVTTKGENSDEMVDSYEKYVEQYLKYVKKVNDGDISAMTEYAELLDKTTDLSEKMEKAKGQLSPEQLKRYLNITNKFTTGIIDVTQ
mgnify:FL=1